ncbi:MAG TPA: MFS transporter [Tepidiformaceae bacterium]|nr:MFS transporter [Tepidiformaceae bacterium]
MIAEAAGPQTLRKDRTGLWLAMLVACVQDGIYALIFLSYMNHYLLDVLNTSGAMPGVALALYGLCKVAGHPVAGRLLDRTSPRLVYWLAVVLQACGLLVMLAFGSIAAFLTAACLLAFGSAAAWPLLYEMVARTQAEEDHTSSMSILSIAGYVATGFGFVLGVLLARFTPWRVAVVAVLVPVAVPLIFQGLHPVSGHSSPETDGRHRIPVRERIAAVAVFGAAVLANFAAVSSIAAAYGPYTRRTLGLDLVQTMGVLAPAGVAALAGLWAAAHWSRPERRMVELALMAVVAAAGTLVLSAVSQPALAALVAIPPAAALGAMGPVIAAAVIEYAGTNDRGLVIGTLMAIEGVGGVAGPALTALVIGVLSPAAGFAAIGVMFIAMAALTLAARRPVPHPATA